MSSDDPEKLLSDALRAQATQAPAADAQVGFGLLSGSDLPARHRTEPTDTDATDRSAVETRRLQARPRQVPATLILLLALLLGLASGAVVGLLTLI